MAKKPTDRDRMSRALREWMRRLKTYPGWEDFTHKKVSRTLHYDSPIIEYLEDFTFDSKTELEHAVIIRYLSLEQGIHSLKDCEYYFRRYPFRGLPLSRSTHLTTICEMYFGRFYELRERIKNFFDALNEIHPTHGIGGGQFIALFDKIFDREIRARHSIHHRERFDEVGIGRLYLYEIQDASARSRRYKLQAAEYRRLSREWVERVRQRGEKMDEFLEAIAGATLKVCDFLK